MTLTEFLLARIDEDEAVAKAVAPLAHNYDMGGNRQEERWYVSRLQFSSLDGRASSEEDEAASQHFARHDPARVLAECEAKRRIVEHLTSLMADADRDSRYEGTTAAANVSENVLPLLALPYADHPDYREEWKP